MCQYFFFACLFDVTEVIVTIAHLKSKVGTFLDPDVSVWLFFLDHDGHLRYCVFASGLQGFQQTKTPKIFANILRICGFKKMFHPHSSFTTGNNDMLFEYV